MFFKTIILCFFVVFASACSNETIPRHQKTIKEDSSQKVEEEIVLQEFSDFDGNQKEIDNLINSKDPEKLEQALVKLEGQIFSKKAEDPVVYTSLSFAGYINLYVKLFVYSKNNKKSENDFSEKYQKSLVRFKNSYIDGCVDSELRECEKLKSALVKNTSVVVIVNDFIEKENSLSKKLKLVGFAYDLMGRREQKKLNSLYISTMIEVLKREEAGKNTISRAKLKPHMVNLIALLVNINWLQPNLKAMELYFQIKPWRKNLNNENGLGVLRSELFKYLPIFVNLDNRVKSDLSTVVGLKIKALAEKSYDLSSKPAFKNIKLNKLASKDPILVYLALELYFGGADIKEANLFFSRLENQNQTIKKFYNISKLLIRWDIAQLSIKSTKSIAKEFARETIKSADFVQDMLEYSKSLVPEWTSFHNVRLATIKTFMNGYYGKMSESERAAAVKFYSSINRNILKTTVYPNMLAFMYHMGKTEWQAKIRVWFWEVTVNSAKIFEDMMTGQYYYPWFNFTDLREDGGYSDNTRTSLFRSEILDSFYYLIATKAYEEYDVEIDALIKMVSQTVFKRRLPEFEEVMEFQRKFYFSKDQAVHHLLKWCSDINSNVNAREQLPFYSLHEYLTPYTNKMKQLKGVFGENTPDARMPLYFDDVYVSNRDLGLLNVSDINDRFKLEFLPIMHTTSQMIKIAQRLKTKHSSDLTIETKESNKYFSQMLKMQKAYLGYQIHISQMMSPCSQTAGLESRRRARDLGFAEYTYYEKIVHPLLKKTMSGELTATEANNILKKLHDNQEAFLDEIIFVNDKVANYKVSRLGYMLRVRKLLIDGLSLDNQYLGKINIPAVVGSHLSIALPSGLMRDKENPYFYQISDKKNPVRNLKFHDGIKADEFAKSAIPLLTDQLSGVFIGRGYTRWDKTEVKDYFNIDQKKIEFRMQLLQLRGQEYIDFSNENCIDYKKTLPKECYKLNKASLDELAMDMAHIFKKVELSPEKEKYLDLIVRHAYIDDKNMSVQMKLDRQGIKNFRTGALPYSEPAGFFDLAINMAKAEYLGVIFNTNYDKYVSTIEGGERASHSCRSYRSGCYWKMEKERARQYFLSRSKRPGMIFNFDRQILEENYEYIKKQVLNKFELPREIEKYGASLLNKYRRGKLDYYFDRSEKPAQLKALSPYLKYSDADADTFLVEETESFYKTAPNWNLYLDNE